MLKPAGIPKHGWAKETWNQKTTYPKWIQDAAGWCIIVGESDKWKVPVFSPDGCILDSVGALIATDRGLRQLLKEELAKAKGVSSQWLDKGKWTSQQVEELTDIHLWAAVSASLHHTIRNPHKSLPGGSEFLESIDTSTETEDDGEPTWDWVVPDLSEGGDWHRARVDNLRKAIEGLPNAEEAYAEGLEALQIHRLNYEGDGTIHRLQLLWWEFPPEHWNDLRTGCPMNFLTEPTDGIVKNAPMTEDQIEIATDFIDELEAIGVFEPIPEGSAMKANCPLFAVPKPGQPGQWRIIADMKNGGQNAHIGKDPVHLP
jgi:hypothetical protein